MKNLVLLSCILFCSILLGQGNIKQVTPLQVYQNDSISVASYNYEGVLQLLKTDDPNKTYVINFWATWCMPCVKELPYFEKLNTNYEDKNVEVLLVSLDFPKKIESSLLPFIAKKKLKSNIIVLNDANVNYWIDQVDTSWSGALPATLIIKGEERKFYERSFTYEELENELLNFIQ
ncbi:TlpA disulfide reductase family protein [Flavobacterium chuncheonense]|uniref:TlpA disulfide reductase family protein n=1 Tax=Flavobacterium chuncheonense TaxID=2026653 RepID=A0ABW5YNN8_9FLAO